MEIISFFLRGQMADGGLTKKRAILKVYSNLAARGYPE
jgi:hypothetical protein